MLYVGENANNPAANALKPNLTIFRIVKKVKRNILACQYVSSNRGDDYDFFWEFYEFITNKLIIPSRILQW